MCSFDIYMPFSVYSMTLAFLTLFFVDFMELHVRAMSFRLKGNSRKNIAGVVQLIIKPSHPNIEIFKLIFVDLAFKGFHISVCLCRIWLTVFECVLNLTIFSSCPGGFLRKRQRGAKKISTIPMMVISQGKPMLSAMDPPIDGPASSRGQITYGFSLVSLAEGSTLHCSLVLTRSLYW